MHGTTEKHQNADHLTVYGSRSCPDTLRSMDRLEDLHVPYRFVDVDHDTDAREMITDWNGGRAKTPTIAFGAGQSPRLVEPTNEELDRTLRERGLLTGNTTQPD